MLYQQRFCRKEWREKVLSLVRECGARLPYAYPCASNARQVRSTCMRSTIYAYTCFMFLLFENFFAAAFVFLTTCMCVSASFGRTENDFNLRHDAISARFSIELCKHFSRSRGGAATLFAKSSAYVHIHVCVCVYRCALSYRRTTLLTSDTRFYPRGRLMCTHKSLYDHFLFRPSKTVATHKRGQWRVLEFPVARDVVQRRLNPENCNSTRQICIGLKILFSRFPRNTPFYKNVFPTTVPTIT